MKTPTVGRNDPCPCGSGKKYKKCCLEKAQATAPHGAGESAEDLREALKGRQFGSLDEVQAFVEQHTQRRNQSPLEEFHGLSPEQMYRMLHFPFTSPELVRFADTLNETPTAPVLTLFGLLAEAIGEQGLKATAKGNLPRKFCREAAANYWGEETYQKRTRYGGVNREENFSDLHTTRLLAELAGLVRKYKGRFILSRDCRKLLAGKGLAAVYPILFKTYVQQFNWAYRDHLPELPFLQSAFLFTLYLLTRYGDTWRPHEFYEDCFLGAFPAVLNEIPPNEAFAPRKIACICYRWRTLENFAGFMGLATVERISENLLDSKYRVQALPQLFKAVQFPFMG